MRAILIIAVLCLSTMSARAADECKTFSTIVEEMQVRFPDAYLHSGPIEGEKHTYYAFAAEGVPTLLVFAFDGGCFVSFFEISNSRLFGSVS